MAYVVRPLPPVTRPPRGISTRTLELHHGTIYTDLVAQKNGVADKLHQLVYGGTGELGISDEYASQLRALKAAERAITNAVTLHECYFGLLGGDGVPVGPLADALTEKFGTIDRALRYLAASALSARRWAVLAWDSHEHRLRIYAADGDGDAFWASTPIIAIDVVEHAYLLDHGVDRKSYVRDYLDSINWQSAGERYALHR